MSRLSIVRVTLASSVLALAASVAVRAQQTPASGPAAAETYKNITTLKIPADQLEPTMAAFTAALGVQCAFCHVPDAPEKDDIRNKATARQMIQMVDRFNAGANDITLTCTTCHHGHNQPERTPPLAVEMTPAEASAFAARMASRATPPGPGAPAGPPGAAGRGPARPTETVAQVVDKYVQAMGGHAALEAKTRVMKGTETTRDLQTSPLIVQETSGGGYRSETDSTPMPIRHGSVGGRNTWFQMAGQTHDLDGFTAAMVNRLADFTLPATITQRYNNLAVGRYGTVNGTATIGLQGRVDSNTVEQLQFARDSGLLLRRTVQTRTPYGPLVEQIDYSDYRDVAGVEVPFQVRYANWDTATTEKFTDVKINAAVDAAVFARPAGK